MPTRRSKDNELHQHRFFSAVEFVEQRPLNGVAVCERAGLLEDPRERRMIWFLHSKSITPGLPQFARELLAAFPDRLGTRTTRSLKVKPDGRYDRNVYFDVSRDLLGSGVYLCGGWTEQAEMLAQRHGQWPPYGLDVKPDEDDARDYVRRFAAKGSGQTVTGQELLAQCIDAARHLPRTLAEWCLDPHVQPSSWRVDYLDGNVGELILEYAELQAARALEEFALTSIGRIVWDELDRCRASGRAVSIIGETGIGKTESCSAWCRQHEGQVVRVSLNSICNRTTFFQALAGALGIASALTRTASKLELRVREVLQQAGLMVIIEEFHYAFPRCKRPTAPPELPDWIYGALIDHRVPVALVSTPQISRLLRDVEDSTGWNGRQWSRRVRRSGKLPDQPTREDLVKVAEKLLPEGSAAMIKAAVGFAGRLTEQLDALVDLVAEARAAASFAGRERVIPADLLAGLREVESVYLAKAPARPEKTTRRKSQRQSEFLPEGAFDDDEPAALPPSREGAADTLRPSRVAAAQPSRRQDFSLAGHPE